MGSPVFPGKAIGGWWGGVVTPTIPLYPPPLYPAAGTMYPPPPAYSNVLPPAPVRQHPQAGGATWGAQGGKAEEHRRAWEKLGVGGEEAAGEGTTDNERSGQGGRGMDDGAGHTRWRGGAGSRGAAESVGGSLEKAGEGGEGRAGR